MELKIPESILRKLKCSRCNKFVSSGPVYETPDSGVTCGRCRTTPPPNYRNYAFEELAKIFVYPCKNWDKHCSVELKWNVILEHEDECPFNSYSSLLCKHPRLICASKRYLPRQDKITYIVVPEESIYNVVCENCEKFLSADPILINKFGRSICHRCYFYNKAPSETLRNESYETVAKVMRFPCVFSDRGCTTRSLFGKDSIEHEHTCQYDTSRTSIVRTSIGSYKSSNTHKSSIQKDPLQVELEARLSVRQSQIAQNDEAEDEIRRLSSIKHVPSPRQNAPKDIVDVNIPKSALPFAPKFPRLTNLDRSSSSFGGYDNRRPNTILDDISLSRGNEIHRSHSVNINGDNRQQEVSNKERGIIPTHRGHTYGTLCHKGILFAPPNIQKDRDQTNNRRIASEYREAYRQKHHNIEEVYETNKLDEGQPASSSTSTINAQSKWKQQITSNDKEEIETVPIVELYAKYNPQNVLRSDSFKIGNPALISELKKQQRNRLTSE